MKISELIIYLIKISKSEMGALILMACIILSLVAQCQKDNYYNSKEDALLDSLHKTKNKLGQETSTRLALSESYSDLKRQSRSNKEEIKRLKSIVDRKTVAAIIIKNHTEYKYINKTDTVYKDLDGFPIYVSSHNDRWINYSITSRIDTTILDLKLLNEYEIRHQWKKRKLELQVKNLNPYTITDNIISYSVKERKRKMGIGVQAGYGISKNGLSPYVGFGIQYNLISF